MSELTTKELVDETIANQKFILVQTASPTISYDGQVWTCTSSNPPLLKVYDETNTQWMMRHPARYETGADGYKTRSQPPALDGVLSIQYSSGGATTSGQAFLYFKANDLWWGLKEQ